MPIGLVPSKGLIVLCIFNKYHSHITINARTIEQVKLFKYLGLLIDSKFSFKQHILEVTKKLNQCNRAIQYLKNILPTHILLKIFYCIGYPFLNLHILSWGGSFPSYLKPLNISCNKIIRSIHYTTNNDYIDTINCYKNLKIPNLNQLFNMKLADLMYRTITGESPIQRDFLVDVNWTHDYPTRRGNQLKFPPSNTRAIKTSSFIT